MTTETQYILVGLVLAAAAGYLGRQVWRRMNRPSTTCGGNCGCDKATPNLGTRRELLQLNVSATKAGDPPAKQP